MNVFALYHRLCFFHLLVARQGDVSRKLKRSSWLTRSTSILLMKDVQIYVCIYIVEDGSIILGTAQYIAKTQCMGLSLIFGYL